MVPTSMALWFTVAYCAIGLEMGVRRIQVAAHS